MRKFFLGSAILALICALVFSQGVKEPKFRKEENAGYRWRFFFSPHARRDTFLVDTAMAHVYIETVDDKRTVHWETVPIRGEKPSGIYDQSLPLIKGRFLIVFSPLARTDTFLLDTETGLSWQLTDDSQGHMSFEFTEKPPAAYD